MSETEVPEDLTPKSKPSNSRAGCFVAVVFALITTAIVISNLEEILEVPVVRGVVIHWIGISPVPTFEFVQMSTETLENGDVLRTYIARNWVDKAGSEYFCRARFDTLDVSSGVTSSLYADLHSKEDGGVVVYRKRELERDDFGVFWADTILRDAALQSSEWSDWNPAPRGVAEAFHDKMSDWG